jgi:hypothetical protein
MIIFNGWEEPRAQRSMQWAQILSYSRANHPKFFLVIQYEQKFILLFARTSFQEVMARQENQALFEICTPLCATGLS